MEAGGRGNPGDATDETGGFVAGGEGGAKSGELACWGEGGVFENGENSVELGERLDEAEGFVEGVGSGLGDVEDKVEGSSANPVGREETGGVEQEEGEVREGEEEEEKECAG